MSDQTLAQALAARPFSERHVGPDDQQVTDMLKALGLSSLDHNLECGQRLVDSSLLTILYGRVSGDGRPMFLGADVAPERRRGNRSPQPLRRKDRAGWQLWRDRSGPD